MPNANVLKQKQEQVAALAEKMKNSAAGVLVDYRGITVADDTKLRRELREAGVEYAVIKNNILRRAAEEAGLGELTAHMYGTSAFAYSPEDPIAAAKILNKFAESHKDKFDIRAGYMDGKVLDEAGVIAVAKLPGKQELLTMLCMALNGNIRGLAVALDPREKGGRGCLISRPRTVSRTSLQNIYLIGGFISWLISQNLLKKSKA